MKGASGRGGSRAVLHPSLQGVKSHSILAPSPRGNIRVGPGQVVEEFGVFSTWRCGRSNWDVCRTYTAFGGLHQRSRIDVGGSHNHSLEGLRGIVVGHNFRWLVARTTAQQINPAVERATAPFQHALMTRVGVESVVPVVQTFTDLDLTATVLSVD